MTSDNVNVSPHGKTKMLLLCIFLGGLGVHRFVAGKPGSAIAFIATGGGILIWWIVDIVNIASGKFQDSAGRTIK